MNTLKNKNVLAIDWSGNLKTGIQLAYLDDNGIPVSIQENKTFRVVLEENYNKYDAIVVESTFESYSLKERNSLIDKFGEKLYTINPRQTPHQRLLKNIGDKNNENDALAILDMVLNTDKHFSKAHKFDETAEKYERKSFMKKIAQYRNQGWDELVNNLTEEEVNLAENILKSIESDFDFQLKFGEYFGNEIGYKRNGDMKKNKFSRPFAIPIILAAINSMDKTEFERKIGCYGNANPSVIRSNFYYSRVESLLKRKTGTTNGSDIKLKDMDKMFVLSERKNVMKGLRRAVRAIWHKVKEYNTKMAIPI